MIQALSGLAAIQADGETGRPKMIRTIIPDKTTAVTAAQAITAALFSLRMYCGGTSSRDARHHGGVPVARRHGWVYVGGRKSKCAGAAVAGLIFKTQDGYITAGAMSDSEWRGMCTALGHLEWLEDPRFLTVNDRAVNATDRISMTGDVLATNTSAHGWSALMPKAFLSSGAVSGRCDYPSSD